MQKMLLLVLFIADTALSVGLNLEGFIVKQKNEIDDGTIFGSKTALISYKKDAFTGQDIPGPVAQFAAKFCGKDFTPKFQTVDGDANTITLRLVCDDADGVQTYLLGVEEGHWAGCKDGRKFSRERIERSLDSKLVLKNCSNQWLRIGEGRPSENAILFVGDDGKTSCLNKAKAVSRLLNLTYADRLKDWNGMNASSKTREQTRFLNDIATCDDTKDQAAIEKLTDPYFNQTFDTSTSMAERQKLAQEVTKDVLAKPNGKQILKNCELMAVGANSWFDFALGEAFYCEPSEVSCQYKRGKRASEIKVANDVLASRLGENARTICCNALPDKFMLTNGGCVPTRIKSQLAH